MPKARNYHVMTRFIRGVTLLMVIGGLGLAIAGYLAYPEYREFKRIADSFELSELDNIPAISEVFDCVGMRYSRLEGEVRYVVPLAQISPNFIKALLAREDARFYQHHGIDYPGNVVAAGVKEGASTITQQLARNTFPLDEDRWRRKFVEALLAIRIEKDLNKEKILEAYCNRIYYGIGLYGVETASRACFGKSASELTLSEAAILAGLIRSPNRLNPLEDTRTALAQRDQVLARMQELKMISAAEAKAAMAEPMPLAKRLLPPTQDNYAMDAVMRDLTILIPKEIINRGGLKIYTTIDRRLQMIAEDAVEAKLAEIEAQKGWRHPKRVRLLDTPSQDSFTQETESPYVQGALVAIDNETGGIRAIVGGRDFKESPYNRALLAKRQIGSTFKPFVYAAAFARGMAPGTLVDDAPIREGDIAGLDGSWSPENSDGQNQGLQPASLGLIRSRNTMTVRVGEYATRQAVRSLALKAGFEDVPDTPAIYLGAFETTLKNLTAAYTMFPNNGVRKQPYIIESIEDRDGKTIYKASRAELRCVTPAVAYVMNELLRDVITRGTATAAASFGLRVPAAGKTGTTDDYKDAWFIGYTTRLTCGAWVGMDRPQSIADRGYGSKLALPIWVDFIQNASAWKYVGQKFAAPGNLRTVRLCRTSGVIATPECTRAGTMYQAQLPELMIPHKYCADHGGALAGLSTERAAGSESSSLGEHASQNVPVARAVSITSESPPQEQRGSYRMIRTQNGFIFEHSR
jgi:penicillin-binding protein 1A